VRDLCSFQFFPSCCPKEVEAHWARGLSAFNSFPVAAELLVRCSLLSLSSANFEDHENSPALPSYTCSNSCKPFPDSRRKEGQWTERNDV
jgi:hypothetical protein